MRRSEFIHQLCIHAPWGPVLETASGTDNITMGIIGLAVKTADNLEKCNIKFDPEPDEPSRLKATTHVVRDAAGYYRCDVHAWFSDHNSCPACLRDVIENSRPKG